ncbi:MAG TPA: hypothetical protein PLP29_07040 [Candidatus Ozemobacteraceae bacterium]|nr:hypothetical protein [Candidatus Ozemobacteraceae bacterium]
MKFYYLHIPKYRYGSYLQLFSNEKECFSFDLSNEASGKINFKVDRQKFTIEKLGYGDFEISKDEVDDVEHELKLDNCFKNISKDISKYFVKEKRSSNQEIINYIMISGRLRCKKMPSIGFSEITLVDFNGFSVNGRIVAYFKTDSLDELGITIAIDSDIHPWICFCSENVKISRNKICRTKRSSGQQ